MVTNVFDREILSKLVHMGVSSDGHDTRPQSLVHQADIAINVRHNDRNTVNYRKFGTRQTVKIPICSSDEFGPSGYSLAFLMGMENQGNDLKSKRRMYVEGVHIVDKTKTLFRTLYEIRVPTFVLVESHFLNNRTNPSNRPSCWGMYNTVIRTDGKRLLEGCCLEINILVMAWRDKPEENWNRSDRGPDLVQLNNYAEHQGDQTWSARNLVVDYGTDKPYSPGDMDALDPYRKCIDPFGDNFFPDPQDEIDYLVNNVRST